MGFRTWQGLRWGTGCNVLSVVLHFFLLIIFLLIWVRKCWSIADKKPRSQAKVNFLTLYFFPKSCHVYSEKYTRFETASFRKEKHCSQRWNHLPKLENCYGMRNVCVISLYNVIETGFVSKILFEPENYRITSVSKMTRFLEFWGRSSTQFIVFDETPTHDRNNFQKDRLFYLGWMFYDTTRE